MCDRELPAPPEETRRDLVARGVKGLAGGAPLVGGVLAEAVDLLWSPLRKRQEDWLLALWLEVRRLQERSVLPADEALAANAAFVSAAAHAVRIAATAHQQEKLEALRNAVLNAAAGSAPSDDVQMMFLDAVDSLTASHMRFLSVLSEVRLPADTQSLVDGAVANFRRRGRQPGPQGALSFAREWAQVATPSATLFVDPFSDPPDMLHPMWPPVLPDVLGWQLLQMLKDLEARGFIVVHPPADQFTLVTVTRASAGVTPAGREFLAFITSPSERKHASA